MELSAQSAHLKAHAAREECCSAKIDAESLKAKCRNAEFKAQVAVESARGANAVSETRLRDDFNEKMESVSALQEVLHQAQESWLAADTKNRILAVENSELDARVRSLNSELVAAKSDAGRHKDAGNISQVQAALISVQS